MEGGGVKLRAFFPSPGFAGSAARTAAATGTRAPGGVNEAGEGVGEGALRGANEGEGVKPCVCTRAHGARTLGAVFSMSGCSNHPGRR